MGRISKHIEERDPYKENLMDQARIFYYNTCLKNKVCHSLVNRVLSEVESKFITLRNRTGFCLSVRYTSNHLYIEFDGKKYSEKIVTPDQIIKSKGFKSTQTLNKKEV